MQPLNPFLCAFFKSTLPAQCTPVHHHVRLPAHPSSRPTPALICVQILLVPTTDVLLTSRDRDSGALYSDLAGSEEFLGSHVLRVPASNATAGGKDAPNMRESRGK